MLVFCPVRTVIAICVHAHPPVINAFALMVFARSAYFSNLHSGFSFCRTFPSRDIAERNRTTPILCSALHCSSQQRITFPLLYSTERFLCETLRHYAIARPFLTYLNFTFPLPYRTSPWPFPTELLLCYASCDHAIPLPYKAPLHFAPAFLRRTVPYVTNPSRLKPRHGYLTVRVWLIGKRRIIKRRYGRILCFFGRSVICLLDFPRLCVNHIGYTRRIFGNVDNL